MGGCMFRRLQQTLSVKKTLIDNTCAIITKTQEVTLQIIILCHFDRLGCKSFIIYSIFIIVFLTVFILQILNMYLFLLLLLLLYI